jgi:hypothetical protein
MLVRHDAQTYPLHEDNKTPQGTYGPKGNENGIPISELSF